MPWELTLSQEVQAYIQSLDQDDIGLTTEEFSELQHHRAMTEVIADVLIKTRETITDSKLEMLEELVKSDPELVKGLLDDRFTRNIVSEIPGYVSRTLQLSRLDSTRLPSTVTNGYLREAVRTYIFGLPQASVALSRAALEQALKEGIGYQSSKTFVKMNDLLEEAECAGVIDGANRQSAREVANAADEVLHENPTTLPKSFEVLIKLRGILQFIYSNE